MMEYLDLVDEKGNPTGEIVSRNSAHREGLLHRTAHVWIVRECDGRTQILLQKRSMKKESFPGLFDTSSAGHIPSGSDPIESALRELLEELGIEATEEQLSFVGFSGFGMKKCSTESFSGITRSPGFMFIMNRWRSAA